MGLVLHCRNRVHHCMRAEEVAAGDDRISAVNGARHDRDDGARLV